MPNQKKSETFEKFPTKTQNSCNIHQQLGQTI